MIDRLSGIRQYRGHFVKLNQISHETGRQGDTHRLILLTTNRLYRLVLENQVKDSRLGFFTISSGERKSFISLENSQWRLDLPC